MVDVEPLPPALGRGATPTLPEPTAPPGPDHHSSSAVPGPGVLARPAATRPDAALPASPRQVLQRIDALVATASRSEAEAQIVELVGRDRRLLEDIHVLQVQRMHRLPVDDFHATAVLRSIEGALATLPRPPVVERSEPLVPPRRRWRRRRRPRLRDPRRQTAAASAVVLLASAVAACGGADDAAPVDPIPLFGTTDDGAIVGWGDLAFVPPPAATASLSLDGVAVPVEHPVCVMAPLALPGPVGFQATIGDGRGWVQALVDRGDRTGEAYVVLDGEIIDVGELDARLVGGAWNLEERAGAAGEEVPRLILVFECPPPAPLPGGGPALDEVVARRSLP